PEGGQGGVSARIARVGRVGGAPRDEGRGRGCVEGCGGLLPGVRGDVDPGNARGGERGAADGHEPGRVLWEAAGGTPEGVGLLELVDLDGGDRVRVDGPWGRHSGAGADEHAQEG